MGDDYMRYLLFILATLILLFALAGCTKYKDGEPVNKEPEEEQQEDTIAKEEAKKEEQPKEEPKKDKKKESTEKEKPEKQTIKVDKEIELGNINLRLENVYVEGNELSFGFWWNHWASNDKVHFSYFAYPVVTQNGEELEQQDDKDTLLRQTAKGVDSRVELKYKLKDDSPVEIKFKTTTDNPEEEIITVDIK